MCVCGLVCLIERLQQAGRGECVLASKKREARAHDDGCVERGGRWVGSSSCAFCVHVVVFLSFFFLYHLSVWCPTEATSASTISFANSSNLILHSHPRAFLILAGFPNNNSTSVGLREKEEEKTKQKTKQTEKAETRRCQQNRCVCVCVCVKREHSQAQKETSLRMCVLSFCFSVVADR